MSNESIYKPEGSLIMTKDNNESIKSVKGLENAKLTGKILEARSLICDRDRNLIVDLGDIKGIIPRKEAALESEDGTIKDVAIITKVNKPVCFKVMELVEENGEVRAILSRKNAQKQALEYFLNTYVPGDIIDSKVTHLATFGCFVDIGCGISSLIPIDNISISRISHPSDRFKIDMNIKAIVKQIDYATTRVTLSHKELLGTWEENVTKFEQGQTVAGIIRSVENYGIFVELTPNLTGLAEYKENVSPGEYCAVYIKNIIPPKMKIKLIIIDAFSGEYIPPKIEYFITSDHLDHWLYSPTDSIRQFETIFEA